MSIISTFLGFLGISAAGIYVIFKGSRKVVNISYFLMAISVGMWAFSHWLLQISFSRHIWDPVIIARLSFLLGSLVPPCYVLFAMTFPRADKWPRFENIALVFLPALFLSAISITDFFVIGMQRMNWGFKWDFNSNGFLIFNIFISSYIISGIYLLTRKLTSSSGLSRLQVKYMLISTAITATCITFFNGILPLIGFDQMVPFGPSSTLVLLAATAYAIVRYRLLDTEVIVSKLALFSITIFGVFVFHIIFIYFARTYIGYDIANLTSLGIIFLILLFTPLSRKAQKIIDVFIYHGKYDYRETLRESSKALVTMLDLDTLLDYFLNIIATNIGVPKVALFLKSQEGPSYRPLVSFGIAKDTFESISLYEDSPVIEWIKSNKTIFIKEATEREASNAAFKQLYGELEKINTELLIPLFYKGKTLGVLSLDNKATGSGYSSEDLDVLETLVQQASIAIENARLYSEAITDSLTGLYHHKYFEMRLDEEIERARRFNHTVSLLIIDIDHFKGLNDTYGHLLGDRVLKDISNMLKNNCRSVDIPARYGGDELALIMIHSYISHESSLDDCRKLALSVGERIRKKVEEMQIVYEDKLVKFTSTIGVSTLDPLNRDMDREQLFKLADMALYKAKEEGRNRVGTV